MAPTGECFTPPPEFKMSFFLTLVLFLTFCLPGIPLGIWLCGRNIKSQPEGLFYGLLLGHLISTGLVVVLVYLFSFSWLTLLGYLVITTGGLPVLLRSLGWPRDKKIPLRSWTRNDYLVLVAGLALFLVLAVPPHLNMGRKTPFGYAFHGTFAANSLRDMAFIAELSKGEMPPSNPFFAGETLHYYWLSFMAPAAVYRILGKGASLQSLLSWHILLAGTFFLLTLFSALRLYTRRASLLGAGMFLGLLAGNYKGFYMWWTFSGDTWGFLDHVQHVAVEPSALRLWRVGIWSLYHHLLVAPQHLFALAFFLMGWTLYMKAQAYPEPGCGSQRPEAENPLRPAAYGLHPSAPLVSFIMGALFGYSGFMGLVAIPWYGGCLLISALSDKRALGKNLVGFFAMMGILALPLLAFYSLDMVIPTRGNPVFYINKTFLTDPVRIFLLNLGPGFVLGTLGILTMVWTLKSRAVPYLWLMAICLVLFTTIIIKNDWEVTSKSSMLIAIALAFSSVSFLDALSDRLRRPGFILWGVGLLCLPAVPSVLLDAYNYAFSASPRTTKFIRPEDMKALTWIRDNLPEKSVILDKPFGFDKTDKKLNYAKIPTFAQRRTALGDRLDTENAQVPAEQVASRKKDIDTLFETYNPAKALDIAKRLGVQYVYVGPTERASYPSGLSKFNDFPNLFRQIYRQAGVSIFQILDGEPELVSLRPSPPEKTSYQAKEVIQIQVALQNQNYNHPVQVELTPRMQRVGDPGVSAQSPPLPPASQIRLGPKEEKVTILRVPAPENPGAYQVEILGRVVLEGEHQMGRISFEAEDLPSHTGQNMPDPEDSTGISRVGSGYPIGGFLTYGPHVELPAGKYRTLFRLKGKDFQPESQVALLEVTADQGRKLLARKALFAEDFIKPESFQEFEIGFVLEESEEVEFRTYFQGLDGELFVDNVTITVEEGLLKKRSGIEEISFQSENLPHNIGRDISDPEDSTGVSRVGLRHLVGGFLTYGPYVELPAGEYRALFRLKGKDLQPGDPIAILEIVADQGRQLLAREKLFGEDFTGLGSFQEFEVSFILDRSDKVEFRTYFYGQHGELFVDSITVLPKEDPLKEGRGIEKITFQSEDLPHNIGQNMPDPEDSTGVSRVGLGRSVRGFLTYGPYIELPAGDYQASFRLKGKDFQPGNPIAALEVVANKGRQLLARRELFTEAFTQLGSFQEFRLPFALDKTSKVEFRTYFHGRPGDLFMDNITVEQNLLIFKKLEVPIQVE